MFETRLNFKKKKKRNKTKFIITHYLIKAKVFYKKINILITVIILNIMDCRKEFFYFI